MAFQSSPVLDFSFKAAEDLSSYQYHFVKIDTSGKAKLLDASNELPDGVLQNAPAEGEEATVRILGISKVVAKASLDEGTFVKGMYSIDADCGKAASSESTKSLTMGRVVGASGADGDLCSVLLTPYVGLS